MTIAKNVKPTAEKSKQGGGARGTKLREVNDWTVFYSAPHPPRKATRVYVKTHHDLVYVQYTPCWICGLIPDHTGKFVTLDPKGQPYVNETHHDHIEDADFLGIDITLVMKDFPDWDWSQVNPKDKRTFFNVGDAEKAMRVICNLHHRATRPLPDFRGILGVGIHHIPFPIWQLQRWQSNEFPLFREGDPKTTNFDPAQHLNLKFEKHLVMAQEAAHSEVSVRVRGAKTDAAEPSGGQVSPAGGARRT